MQIGCQGWNYDDWVSKPGDAPLIYPQNTRAADMLEMYARAFETVEVDSTFYAVPSAAAVEGWRERTPEKFTFSLKLPREITHELSFGGGSAEVLAEFVGRARLLGDKLAVTLIQLPPQFDATAENRKALEAFLARLPSDLRFSVEFRHRSWADEGESLCRALGERNVAVALVEGQWIDRQTLWRMFAKQEVNFAYLRWMGERDLTRFDRVQRAQSSNLELWWRAAERLDERVPHAYAYFSNYYEGHAPASANKLRRMLGQTIVEPGDLEDQPSLF